MQAETDKEGFLRNLADWSESVAFDLARQENIDLTTDHWEIINLVRDYYSAHHISPATRVLVNIVRKNLGADKGRSIHLMKLFSGKPLKMVAKIAGLPKPSNCD
jgi:tRNA 2-thiouridine synthesizing protein E